jgi:hypothetical protein
MKILVALSAKKNYYRHIVQLTTKFLFPLFVTALEERWLCAPQSN